MASQKQSLETPLPVDGDADIRVTNGGDGGRQFPADVDECARAPRLPRWTRQEILVLIQGKRVAENRVRRGRAAGLGVGSGQVEPKWATVSSYCKRHGVNRGPVQCRKRWSNLAGDFKKIKEWESQIKEETDSFWVMRNDLRRERKLPGFFDREVYDILDYGGASAGGGVGSSTSTGLALALAPSAMEDCKDSVAEEMEAETEAAFESVRRTAADDGMFSDFDQSGQDEVGKSPEKTGIHAPVPISAISEKQFRPFLKGSPPPPPPPLQPQGGASCEKPTASNPDMDPTREGWKRRRVETNDGDEAPTMQQQLIETLEKNAGLLGAHLEAQNINSRLDREQRNDHMKSLVAVISKVADALGRIADKL